MASKIEEFRAKFPEYGALSDQELADTMYRKFYEGKVDRADYDRRIGLSSPGILQGMTDAVKQGATFGFADEVAGVAGGVANLLKGQGFGEGYDRATTRVRGDAENFRDQHPVASIGGEVIGGFASVPAKAAQAVAQAPTLLQAVGQGAKAGAGYGAVSGAGNAQGGLENRLVGAGMGAGTGAAVGAALPVVATVAGKVGGKLLDVSGLRNPKSAARNQILRALERDGLSPDDALNRYNNWQMQGAKPEALLDLGGENVRGLARAAAGVPGDAKNRASEFLSQRQAGQAERIADDVANTISPSKDYYATTDALMQARKVAARPLYHEAYQYENVFNDDIANLITRPSMKQALSRAYRIAAEEGRDPTTLGMVLDDAGEVVFNKVPSMQTLDYIKRGLDDVIETFRDSTTGRLRLDESGRAINATKNQFLDILKDRNPAYKKALASYAGPSESLDAMAVGRGIFRPDAEISAKRIAGLSDSDKEFFRAGVVRAIKDLVDNAPDGADAVKRFFNRPAMREKLRAAFPDASDFMRFESAMKREAQMYANAQFVRGGSQTAPRLAEVDDMASDPSFLTSLFTGDLMGAARSGGQSLLRRSQGINSSTADELSGMLFNQGNVPDQLNALMSQEALNRAIAARRGAGGNALRRTLALTGGGAVAPE